MEPESKPFVIKPQQNFTFQTWVKRDSAKSDDILLSQGRESEDVEAETMNEEKSQIVTKSDHGYRTGDPIIYEAADTPTGMPRREIVDFDTMRPILDEDKFFAVVDPEDPDGGFQLATSRSNAMAGKAMNLTFKDPKPV